MTPRRPLIPALLAAPVGICAFAAALMGGFAPHVYHRIVQANSSFAAPFADPAFRTAQTIAPLAWVLICAGLVGVAASLLALRPRPHGRLSLTIAVCCLYVQAAMWIYVTLNAIAALLHASVAIHGVIPDNEQAAVLRLRWLMPALIVGLVAVVVQLLATRKFALRAYGMLDATASPVDAADFAQRMARPRDPASRNGLDFSIAFHFLIIAVLPSALLLHSCSDAYLIPGGGGGGGGGGGDGEKKQTSAVIKLTKPKKQPSRRKKQFGRTNSAISLYFPSIDESTIANDVADITENTYTANTADADISTDAGGFAGEGDGTGFGHGKGSGGGFGGGSASGTFRFIRIQYDDPGWSDGMDANSRADMNFLDELHKVSHLKTADHSEAIPVGGIRNFKRGQSPPFLYFTGTGGAINLSSEDVRVLRQYLLDGGMLFADAGSDEWGRAFRTFLTKLLPDRELLDISNDDPIFSQPFRFPGGAPPLWHHDGSRARGIKIDGRWAVFYFPGNLNDAWKTGHGGQPPAIVTQAMRLGMNIVWYSAVHYIDASRAAPK